LLNSGFYAGMSPYASINAAAVAGPHSLDALFGALLFQSALAWPVFGTNGPLWSLSFEFWFYVFYPALLFLSRRLGAWGMIGVTGGVSGISAVAVMLGSPVVPSWMLYVFQYWVVWAAGALIAEAYVGRIRLPGLHWLSAPATLGLLGLVA